MGALTKYDASTKSAGILNGDSMVRGAQSSLRNIIGGDVSGAGGFQYLSQFGITTAADGTLTVDNNKLTEALNAASASVQKLFGSSSGIAAQNNGANERIIGHEGQVEAGEDTTQTSHEGLDEPIRASKPT